MFFFSLMFFCCAVSLPEQVLAQSRVIYTYFHPDLIHSLADEYETISLWVKAWSRFGFKPHVLNEGHARLHPQFNELYAKFYQLPSTNRKQYEMACYLRYLAVAAVGGGWMADYDIFPLSPKSIPGSLVLPSQFTVYHAGAVPCLLAGNASEFTRVARKMANFNVTADPMYVNGQLHVSDMHIAKKLWLKSEIVAFSCVQSHIKQFPCSQDVRKYGLSPHCANAPIVLHFSHEALLELPKGRILWTRRASVIRQYLLSRNRECNATYLAH